MKSLDKLKKLKKQSFTVKEAKVIGVSAHSLAYLAKTGQIERHAHGLYAFGPEIDLVEIIKDKLKLITNGVIGLHTALAIHDLSEKQIRDIDIIIPESQRRTIHLADVKFFLVREYEQLDVTIIQGIPVTSIEQTIVDLLRTKETMSVCIDVFQKAQQKRHALSFSKIEKLGEIFRAKARVKNLLDALI